MATKKEADGGAAVKDDLSLLDRIIQDGKMARDETQTEYAKDMVSEFATQILDEGMTVNKDTVAMINSRIAQIDELLSLQLNEIMHDEELQKLEGSWRGLNYLVMNTETGVSLKLRLINASKDDLLKDLEKAVEFDQSALFKQVYEAEYGTFGGHPYTVLVGDYEFGRHPQDMALLDKLHEMGF